MDDLAPSAAKAALPCGDPTAALVGWYQRHARVLPWRIGPKARSQGVRPDPYRVWLSEVMLQQTTVKAVIPYFENFTAQWPTIEALAAAPDEAVMAAWAGLGYYSRARNLIACARRVTMESAGQFPQSAAALRELPGIGAYTSAAIAAIAFDEAEPVVDGNVERVMTRYLAISRPLPAAKAVVRERLAPLVPIDRPGEFAEAMMDLGATICTPKKPACVLCPLNGSCAAYQQGNPLAFPVKAPRKRKPTRYGIAYVAVRTDGAILVRRRPPTGLLGGMVEVPGGPWADPVPVTKPPVKARWRTISGPVEHVFTHFRLFVTVKAAGVAQDMPAPDGCWWAEPGRLANVGLPSVMAKIVEAAVPGAALPTERN